MSAAGDAWGLASVLILAKHATNYDYAEAALYEAVDKLQLSDERKADLYARLAERLDGTEKFFQLRQVVEEELKKNAEAFYVHT